MLHSAPGGLLRARAPCLPWDLTGVSANILRQDVQIYSEMVPAHHQSIIYNVLYKSILN